MKRQVYPRLQGGCCFSACSAFPALPDLSYDLTYELNLPLPFTDVVLLKRAQEDKMKHTLGLVTMYRSLILTIA